MTDTAEKPVPHIDIEVRSEFYVWCKKRKWSRYHKHTSQASAEAEAIRLALQNPGFKFHVVEGKSAFVVREPVA